MLHEFYNAMEQKGHKPIKVLGYLCTLLLIPVKVVQPATLAMILVSAVPLIIFIGMAVSVFSKLKYNVLDIAVTLFGAMYIVLMVSFLCSTREMEMGVYLIFYIFCGAWFSDTFAYLIGRKIGKHKLTEISPKKSVEGCIGGVIGTLIFYIVYSIVLSRVNFSHFETYALLKERFFTNFVLLIPLALLVSVISQIGDLAESGIKRYAGIKDFSNLMPGHGGMLDRFDSVLFVAPIVYYTLFIIQHI